MWKDAVLSDFKYNLDIWPEELTIATSVRRKWLSRQLSGGTDYSYVCPEELTIATTVRRKWLSRQLSGGTIPASVWRNYTSVCLEELYQRLSGGSDYLDICLEELFQRLSGGTIPASVRRKWLSRHMSGGTIPASVWRNYTSVCLEELTTPTFVRRNWPFRHLSRGTDYFDICREKMTIPTFAQGNKRKTTRIISPNYFFRPTLESRHRREFFLVPKHHALKTFWWMKYKSWHIYINRTSFVLCDFISCNATLTLGLCERSIELKWQT